MRVGLGHQVHVSPPPTAPAARGRGVPSSRACVCTLDNGAHRVSGNTNVLRENLQGAVAGVMLTGVAGVMLTGVEGRIANGNLTGRSQHEIVLVGKQATPGRGTSNLGHRLGLRLGESKSGERDHAGAHCVP